MSNKIRMQVWEQSQTQDSERMLLLAIAEHAEDNGYAWPGIARLASMIKKSPRHTMRLIGNLEAAGELFVHRQNGAETADYNYRLHGSALVHAGALDTRSRARPDAAGRGSHRIERGIHGLGDCEG